MNHKFLLLFTALLICKIFTNGQPAVCNINASQQVAQHHQAVHVMDDWMRNPFITFGPDSLYYLTCTRYTNDGFKDNLKLWAPEMYFMNNHWILVHTSKTGLGNLAYTSAAIYEAPSIQWGATFGKHHDPSLFQHDDDSIWLVSKCAEIPKIKKDLSGLDGAPIRVDPSDRELGHEGTQIIKFENKYVLFGTGWSTDRMRTMQHKVSMKFKSFKLNQIVDGYLKITQVSYL